MENILKELEWKLEEIFKEIVDLIFIVIGIIAAFSIAKVVGIAAIVISALRKIWDWFFDNPDRKKANAKRKARYEVKKIATKIRKEISLKINREIKKIENNFYNIVREFKKITSKNKEITDSLQKIIDELKMINYATSETFLKYLDKNIEFGYIQVSLKEGTHFLVLCKTCEEVLTKLELIGISKENVYIFNSIQELKDNLSIEKHKSEFFKRSHEIFLKYENELK
ncbi:hypothetical protein [Persephonella sp.]|uniref:hypothetical protein n=1 Tax=Persephonella sp. TaxID=2060922 RepID=UPI00260C3A38|nr:hypothetical protein [Persephonella sp.]